MSQPNLLGPYRGFKYLMRLDNLNYEVILGVLNGGETGIRTLDTLLAYTRFPSVRLQPLGHLSIKKPS